MMATSRPDLLEARESRHLMRVPSAKGAKLDATDNSPVASVSRVAPQNDAFMTSTDKELSLLASK